MGFLDDKPSPEEELKEEIAAAEKELADEDGQRQVEAAEQQVQPDVDASESLGSVSIESIHEESRTEAEESTISESESDQKDTHTAPISALKEEREKRQQYERELGKLQGQMEALMSAIGGAKEQEQEAPPNAEEDPIGALKQLQDSIAQLSQSQETTSRESQIKSAYVSSANEYRTKAPDFADAYNFLIQSRAQELRAYGMSDADISKSLSQEELQVAERAFGNGQNPCEVLYALSEARGYQKQEQPKSEVTPTETPPEPAPAPTIEEQQAKQAAATNISTGGKPPRATITDKDLVNMEGADFDKAWDKVFGSHHKSTMNFAR